MSTFNVGETVLGTIKFTVAGVALDPTTVLATIYRPDGSHYDAHPSSTTVEGTWKTNVIPDQAGTWKIRVKGDGIDGKAVVWGHFEVKPPP